MGILELLLIGIGLSMDAFAVAICQGLCMKKLNWRHAAVIALFFGGFQALMPLIGWVLGSQFAGYIQNIDHWVAFVLLVLIGGNMVREALSPEEEEVACAVESKLDYKQLFLMAVATSIDALSVGFTISEYGWLMALTAAVIIAVVTFFLCMAGLRIGKKFGTQLSGKANILGGVILIGIGLEIFITGVF